jgi:hypothetical protein
MFDIDILIEEQEMLLYSIRVLISKSIYRKIPILLPEIRRFRND